MKYSQASHKASRRIGGNTHLYRHFSADGSLLYVGISKNAFDRLVGGHKSGAKWFDSIDSIKIESFPSRSEAEEAEKAAIIAERPLWNLKYNTPRVDKPKPKSSAANKPSLDLLMVDAAVSIFSMARIIETIRIRAGSPFKLMLDGRFYYTGKDPIGSFELGMDDAFKLPAVRLGRAGISLCSGISSDDLTYHSMTLTPPLQLMNFLTDTVPSIANRKPLSESVKSYLSAYSGLTR